MKPEEKHLEEITVAAMEALHEKIGVANTAAFLNQFTAGYGDIPGSDANNSTR